LTTGRGAELEAWLKRLEIQTKPALRDTAALWALTTGSIDDTVQNSYSEQSADVSKTGTCRDMSR
jgi:hypothetical protein